LCSFFFFSTWKVADIVMKYDRRIHQQFINSIFVVNKSFHFDVTIQRYVFFCSYSLTRRFYLIER
jgi:hypothetical protein